MSTIWSETGLSVHLQYVGELTVCRVKAQYAKMCDFKVAPVNKENLSSRVPLSLQTLSLRERGSGFEIEAEISLRLQQRVGAINPDPRSLALSVCVTKANVFQSTFQLNLLLILSSLNDSMPKATTSGSSPSPHRCV